MPNLPNLPKLPEAPRMLARRFRAASWSPLGWKSLHGGWEPLTAEDDAILAAEYDRACGFDRPREERAKEVYQAVLNAPQVTWVPTSLRQPAE